MDCKSKIYRYPVKLFSLLRQINWWKLTVRGIYNGKKDAYLASLRMKGALTMANHKHLTLDDRNIIQFKINEIQAFRQIARFLDKSPGTISKEVRLYRIIVYSNLLRRIPNRCIHRSNCSVSGLCDNRNCRHFLVVPASNAT